MFCSRFYTLYYKKGGVDSAVTDFVGTDNVVLEQRVFQWNKLEQKLFVLEQEVLLQNHKVLLLE